MVEMYELPLFTKMGRNIEDIRTMIAQIERSRIEVEKKPLVVSKRTKGYFCGTMLIPSTVAVKVNTTLRSYGYEDMEDYFLTIRPKHQRTIDCYVPFYVRHEDVYKDILEAIATGGDDLYQVAEMIECKLDSGFKETFVYDERMEDNKRVISRRKMIFKPRKDKSLDVNEVVWVQAIKEFNKVDKYGQLGIDNYANEMYQKEIFKRGIKGKNSRKLEGFNRERMKNVIRKQNKTRKDW